MHLLTWDVLPGHEDELKIRLEQDINVSRYAILSHRWGTPQDEVSFEDMLAGRGKTKNGYMKLVGCCKQAQTDGLRHVWVDTCCINKASSAELSEAIVSMFTYYQQSTVCYAFLDDVYVDTTAKEDFLPTFSGSAWFGRGWTLQELIAPARVKFFNQSWSFIGDKTDESLSSVIERVTGIDSIVLNIPTTTQLISVSKKMSWAARRKTTRVEDMAYSLMGIFGVHIPPLYGEGSHAFIRLQEAIMRTSNDHTIFAWTSYPTAPIGHGLEFTSTMLALSPHQFEHSSNFKSLPYDKYNKSLAPEGYKIDYAITNSGLSIRLPLLKVDEVEGLYAAFLAVTEGDDQIPSAILLRTTAKTPTGHFWRTNSGEGSIERNKRYWFPVSGRESIVMKDVYILPRFTSISGDTIEPSWSRVNIAKLNNEESLSPELKKLSFAINTEVLKNLIHVPDPSFQELVFLREAHKMISTNQADGMVNKSKLMQLFTQTVLPHRRNKLFCGRTDILQRLRDGVYPSERDPENQDKITTSYVISGMAGIGKTELALEFAYKCSESDLFGAVFWIHGGTMEEILDGFQNIASVLQLTENESTNDTIVAQVLRWLADFSQRSSILSSKRSAYLTKWLLVFDNVEDFSLLQPFWPSEGPGCVLVTSRYSYSNHKLNREMVTLGPLTVQETSEVFLGLTRMNWDFAAVSRLCDGLPLAIAQMASQINSSDISLEDIKYLVEFPERYRLTAMGIHTTLVSSLRDLPETILNILQVLSFLDSNFIPDSILLSMQKHALDMPKNEADLAERLKELMRLGLISRASDRDGLYIHSLVQSEIREGISGRETRNALATAVALVSNAWIQANSTDASPLPDLEMQRYILPHVNRLKDFGKEILDLRDKSRTGSTYVWLLRSVKDQGY